MGFEIRLRIGQNHKVVANTAEWLDKNDIPYRDLVFIQNKLDVHVDVNIDDAPTNIIPLMEANRKVIVFHHEYNADIDTDLRAYNWEDVYAHIQRLATR